MIKIDGLIHYMSELERSLGVTIIIKDFVGFLDWNETSFSPLQQFYIHQSKYCMLIKEQNHLWGQCLHGIGLMQNKLNATHKAYIGHCHAGVDEYVVPIVINRYDEKTIIGAVTVGGFYNPRWEEMRKSLSHVYHINETQADVLYRDSFKPNNYTMKTIEEKVTVIAEYIALLCQDTLSLDQEILRNQFDQNYIIGHAVAYIKNHYKEELTLKRIAEFCHCSPSYVSHNFKKLTGKTLKTYINELRVESSKHLLEQSQLSITDIAYKVGFKDSNYYSKVFSDIFNLSPLSYRKEVQSETIQ